MNSDIFFTKEEEEKQFNEIALSVFDKCMLKNGKSPHDPHLSIHSQEYLLYDFHLKNLLQK